MIEICRIQEHIEFYIIYGDVLSSHAKFDASQRLRRLCDTAGVRGARA